MEKAETPIDAEIDHSALHVLSNEPAGMVACDECDPDHIMSAMRLSPTTMSKPAFLMNFPFSYSTRAANNAWMTDIADDERHVDQQRAVQQFMQLYNYLASDALVYVLPTPPDNQLQDLVFTANLGLVLEHLPDKNTVIVSNYASPPRMGETPVGDSFFRSLGYDTIIPPYKFEGEAELKYLYDNVYIGGYGQRTEKACYEWMEDEFDMKIVKVEEADPYLYHLDCSLFPITREDTMVCAEMYTRKELKAMEKVTNVIDVSADAAFSGICNSVRLHNSILNSSHLHTLKSGTDQYREEISKNRELEDIASSFGMEIAYFNLNEYHKGGALLSCMVMHLNRRSYDFSLM
ncbi:MAG: arginine deiminase-related protein [Pseudomonadota bacterium]